MPEASSDSLSQVATALSATIRGTSKGKVSMFDSSAIPPISIHDYVHRLAKYFECSESCHILALLYLDRFVHHTATRLTNRNVHRLYLTALVVGTKFWDDPFYTNQHYANSGGVRLQELNKLERFFLQSIDYQMYVAPELFNVYHNVVCKVEVPQPETPKVEPSELAKAEDAVSTTAGETSCSSPEHQARKAEIAESDSESWVSNTPKAVPKVSEDSPELSDFDENENEVVVELHSFNQIYHKGSWDDEGSTTVGDDLSVYYDDDMSVFSEDGSTEQKRNRGQPKRRTSRMRHLKPKPHVIWSTRSQYQHYQHR